MAQARTRSPKSHLDSPAKQQLRNLIIEEKRLRRQVERDEEVKRTAPDVWRGLEDQRLAANRETAMINQRLAAVGMAPLPLRPSPAQLRQKLKRLEGANASAIATLLGASSGFPTQRGGTTLAPVRPRRSVKEAR